MTAIADADLQRLFAVAINEQQLAQGIVNTAHDAFCAALNQRLEAADRVAVILDYIVGEHAEASADNDYAWVVRARVALAAYRQSKERT